MEDQTQGGAALPSHDLFALPAKTIAARIDAYLKKWEADPEINIGIGTRGLRKYYHAGAYPSGRWVNIIYIKYQGASSLTKEQAANYLAALDGGHIGKHYGISDASA